MVLANQPLHIHGAPTHLLPVYVADQRLVARIFLAHAASLRYIIFFARHKFGRFLHSFVLRLRVLNLSDRESEFNSASSWPTPMASALFPSWRTSRQPGTDWSALAPGAMYNCDHGQGCDPHL